MPTNPMRMASTQHASIAASMPGSSRSPQLTVAEAWAGLLERICCQRCSLASLGLFCDSELFLALSGCLGGRSISVTPLCAILAFQCVDMLDCMIALVRCQQRFFAGQWFILLHIRAEPFQFCFSSSSDRLARAYAPFSYMP